MPTVLRVKGYRFFFFSMEGNEPPHIHVEYAECVAKFWLNPVQLASAYRFKNHEIKKLQWLVIEHKNLFLEKWYEYFGD